MTEQQELVPVTPQNRALTVTGHALNIDGLRQLTIEEDLIIGRWRLVQKSSSIGGEPGTFNNSLTGEVILPGLQCVVLQITPSRVYFSDDRELICMSRNGLQGVNGRVCHSCQFADWDQDSEGRTLPPPCSRGYSFLITRDFLTLEIIGAMKTSVRNAKIYISALNARRQRPFENYTTFFTERVNNKRGEYFVLRPEISQPLPNPAFDKAEDAFKTLHSLSIQEVWQPGDEANSFEPAAPDQPRLPDDNQDDLPF